MNSKINKKHKMYFDKYLVVTKDGKVGDLLLKMWLTAEDKYLYITNIPNKESETTGYYEDEIDLIEKELVNHNEQCNK